MVANAYIDEPYQIKLYIQPKAHAFLPHLAQQIEQYFHEEGIFFDYFFVSTIPYIDGQVNQALLETIQSPPVPNALHFIEIDSPYYYSLLTPMHFQQKEEQLFDESDRPAILQGETSNPVEWDTTLGLRLFNTAQHFPEHHIDFIDEHGTFSSISYQQLWQRALSTLTQLNQLGIQENDILVLAQDASVDMTIIIWACFLGGIIVFPIPVFNEAIQSSNFLTYLPQLSKEISQLNIVAHDANLVLVREAIKRMKIDPTIPTKTILCSDILLETAGAPMPVTHPGQKALILMTSGSTGVPKLVVHSHRSLIARSLNNIRFNQFSSKDTSLNWFGFDHVGALVMFHIHDVVLGATQLHVKTQYILQSPLNWLVLLERYRITVTWAPNFAFALILSELEQDLEFKVNLSQLRFILNGGESIDYQVVEKTIDVWSRRFKLKKNVIHPAWGMSETSSGVVYSSIVTPSYATNGLVYTNLGLPIPNCELRIVLKNESVAKQGVPGRLQVKSPTLMLGYLHHLNQGQSSFVDGDWFETGDIACMTEKGLIILGRERDIVIINGANHSISDLETHLLFQVKGIIPGCISVLPFYSQLTGQQEFFILVSIKPDVNYDVVSHDIKKVILARFGITQAQIIDIPAECIPKSTIGKIKKNELQKKFIAGQYRSAQLKHSTPTYEYIPEIDIKQWIQIPPFSLDVQTLSLETIVIVIDPEKTLYYQDVITLLKLESEQVIVTSIFTLKETIISLFNTGSALDKVIYLDDDKLALDHILLDYFANTFEILFWGVGYIATHQSHRSCGFHYWRVVDSSLSQLDSDYIALPKIAFFKSIVKECANLYMNACFIHQSDLKKPMLTSYFLRNFLNNYINDTIGCISGQLYKSVLLNIQPTAPVPSNDLFENDCFHVLVGGLGGIGFEIAQCLLQKGVQTILIIGIKKPKDRMQFDHKMSILASFGAHVVFESVNISDQNALSLLIKTYVKRFSKPLGKIIHMAGQFHEAKIFDESIEHIRHLLAAKLTGSLNLLRICQHHPQSELILFSSTNGYFGGAAVATYSLVNAFQHALIGQQLPVKVFVWTMWKQLGMSASIDDELTLAHGFNVLSKGQGIFAFLYGMSLPYQCQFIGLNHHSRQINQLMNNEVQELSFSAMDRITSINTELPHHLYYFTNQKCYTSQEIIQIIKNIWLAALNLDHVHEEDNFFDIGGRSIVIPRIQMEIKQTFDVHLPAVTLYYSPTISLLAQELICHDLVNISTCTKSSSVVDVDLSNINKGG